MTPFQGEPQQAPQVFRTRAVLISGFIDLVIGLALIGTGIGIAAASHSSTTRALCLAIGIAGLFVVFTGAGRLAAKLEVHPDKLIWWWGFARHERPTAGLEEASLVEPGMPTTGAAWETLIAGGFPAIFIWWLLSIVYTTSKSNPTLGTRQLELIPHFGVPIRVRVIGTFATGLGSAQPRSAQLAVEQAIGAANPGPHRP